MRPELSAILDRVGAELVDEIDAENGLLLLLLSKKVLTRKQVESCKAMPTNADKVEKILRLLKYQRDECYAKFCEVLGDISRQDLVEKYLTPKFAIHHQNQPQHVVSSGASYSGLTSESLRHASSVIGSENNFRFSDSELQQTQQIESVTPQLDAGQVTDEQLHKNQITSTMDKLPPDVTIIPHTDLTDLRALSEDSFGVVMYRATHMNWGTVAYRQLKTTILNTTDKIAIKEIVRAAHMHAFRHPNIVAILAVTLDVDYHGVVHEFVSFGRLNGFVDTYEVSWWMKLAIAKCIIRGMNYLHTRDPPVIHCYLNVENVLIGSGFVPKICNFWLPKSQHYSIGGTVIHGDCRDVRIIEPTPAKIDWSKARLVAHIPPENWQNFYQRRSTKYDVYCFGMTLWEILAEQLPFVNAQANVGLIQTAVVAGQRPDLEEIKRDEGDGFIDVTTHRFAVDCIQKCWHQDVNIRSSFFELNKQFEEFLQPRKEEVLRAKDDLCQQVTGSADCLLRSEEFLQPYEAEGQRSIVDLNEQVTRNAFCGASYYSGVSNESLHAQNYAALQCAGATGGRGKTGPFIQPVPKLDLDKLPQDVLTIPYTDLTDLKALAEGGFAVVYRATHANWGTVAYKQLKTTIIIKTDKIANELIQEAQMHVLRHPNIVAMLAVTFEAGHYGVVFEFVSFGGLDGFVTMYEVSWWMKLTIAHGIIQGLNYLHTRDPPVIHGDIKAQNVLIDNGFIPKICDFGLSKWRQYSATRTMSQSQRGTVTHIPPENWQNINQRRTTKYDIYGFGMMLWEILSELPPFMIAQGNAGLIQTAVVAGQRPDLEEIRREEGDGFIDNTTYRFAVDCIQKCWHQDMYIRPSFFELNKQFEEFLQPRKADVQRAKADLFQQVYEYDPLAAAIGVADVATTAVDLISLETTDEL